MAKLELVDKVVADKRDERRSDKVIVVVMRRRGISKNGEGIRQQISRW